MKPVTLASPRRPHGRATPRSSGLALALGVSLGLAACTSTDKPSAPPEPAKRLVDFESCELGRPPAGFTTALTGGGPPVAWVVREDPTAPSGKKVLVQESADDTSYRFPLCVLDGLAARDVSAEVRFKAISGKVDEAAGIVLRYSPENYYIARANALEDNVNLFKTVKGKRETIAEVTVKIPAGEWHRLGFAARGQTLSVLLDGKLVLETVDATFGNAGQAGLWTKADSVTAFDDFSVEALK